MPIDDDAVGIVKWGTGAGASNFNTPADVGFAEADGWPLAYGTPGSGSEPQREVFNWQWRRLTALAVELLTHGGGLPWDSRISYLHPASVMGSDGMLYQSVQGSLNQDPTTDTSDTDWQQVGITLSDTDIKTAYERNADTNALTDALLTRLQGAAPLASPSFSGAVTVPDQTAGTNNARAANTRFVAAALVNKADLVSPVLTGDPRATTATTGDDDTSIATTAFVQAAIAALVDSSPNALNTLNELATALNDDPNFSTTIMNLITDRAVRAGTILDFGGTTAPTGYLLCNSQAVSRATYSTLFAAIGTTWGNGNGSTTFNVPDLRRRVAAGSGGTGTATLGNAVGDTGGEESHTLTVDEMPSHTHTIDRSTSGEVQTGTLLQTGSNQGADVTSNPTGGGQAHNNLQPSAVVTKIIKT